MEFTLSIFLLLMLGAWFGYREIGVSFLGIHIRDLISTQVIEIMQFLVVAALCLLVIFAFDATSSRVNNLTINEAYMIMCGIVMTVAIVRSVDQYTSVVTALWGAVAAFAYHDEWSFHPLMTSALLSILAAPVLGLLFFILYERLFDRIIFRTDRHLLLKNLYMKRLALVGIILGGLAVLLGMTPVIVSPSQLRECSKMSKGTLHRSLVNLMSISVATPIISFLIVTALIAIGTNTILTLIITCFVLVTCLLIIMYSKQRRNHNQTKKALNDELTHNSEAGDERNRLDVAAVTSQFNVMTSEIDIKHNELVNLSLYIKQQRQYLDDLSKTLNDLSREQDADLLRQKLRDTAQKLNENMRLTGEMDQFYTQVEGLHKNFVSRLLMRCPNLSEKEKRLAIMLRLGFSSKDISSMLNIEPKSVEVSRYRFRRKLKLDRSINIVEYLQMI